MDRKQFTNKQLKNKVEKIASKNDAEKNLEPEIVRKIYKALIDNFVDGTKFEGIYVSSHAPVSVKEVNVKKFIAHVQSLAPEKRKDFLGHLFPNEPDVTDYIDTRDISSWDWEDSAH